MVVKGRWSRLRFGNHQDVLFPIVINGRALLEQARDSGRGLIINPTDETATVPLPPEVISVFLEGLDAK
jgi:hypothetical protein